MNDTVIKDDVSTTDKTMAEKEPADLEAGQPAVLEQTEIADVEATPTEPELEVPQDVVELLEEISSSNPVGIEIESSDDDEAISLQMDLEAEMEKRSGNKYDDCVKWGGLLLAKHSKDLPIAVWLTISWFRETGIAGLNKGLILLSELLRKFGEKCYPQDKEKQARVFRSLNNDPRLLILKKISFEEETPIFKVTTEVLESTVAKEELPHTMLFKMTKFKERSFVGEEQFLSDLKNELFPKNDKKLKLLDEHKDILLKIFRESKTAVEPTEFSVTNRFMKIIKPVADFEKHENILLNIKDEKFTSSERFVDDLEQCFSDNNIDRQAIGSYRPLFNCLGNNTIAHLLDLKQTYEHFLEIFRGYFGEDIPELSNLSELIEKPTHDATKMVEDAVNQAQAIFDAQKASELEQKSTPAPASGEPVVSDVDVDNGEAKSGQVENKKVSPIPQERKEDGDAVTVQNLKITREVEAKTAIKKALLFYFPKENVPSQDPTVYGLSRVRRWSNEKLQPGDNAIVGPNEVKQKYLLEKLNIGDFNTVIADFETNFVENEELQFWLDGQRYVVQALEQKGPEWNLCAEEVKFHLAKLLHRLPGLLKLTFRDKKTLFANQETQRWIEDEVLGMMGSGKPDEKILPPIMGEDYESINQEYETACGQLPASFEENAKLMQQAIAGDLRVKGKFLRKLNLANYCYMAKKYETARVLFDELVSHIEQYHIVEWEQALCVSVWQSMYKTNLRLLAMDSFSDQKTKIENENRDLITRVSKYDVVLALNLTKQEGE